MKTLSLGAVTLKTASLPRLQDFYYDILGLDLQSATQDDASLGTGDTALIHIIEDASLPPALPSDAGLYHTAFLYPTPSDLARTLIRILKLAPESFQGSSDHLVSQAFYFADPDGNGIELYVDRPRSKWQYEDGRVKMGGLYLDPMTFIQQHPGKPGGKEGVVIGHVHLKVGDLIPAKRFYVDALGLDITAEVPGALFVSADGYHHHLGLNTWESRGTGRRKKSLGLVRFEIVISDPVQIKKIESRLFAEGFSPRPHRGVLSVEDPWGTEVIIRGK